MKALTGLDRRYIVQNLRKKTINRTEIIEVNRKLLKILLVEDNLAEVELIEDLLAESVATDFQLRSVKRLKEAILHLRQNQFDLILLDLFLPDSVGLKTIDDLKAESFDAPVVVLTALDDQNLAVEAVRKGAQDYLIKGNLEGELLERAINYAIERQQIEVTLRQQASRERLLGRMIDQIRYSLDLKMILQATVEAVEQLLKTEWVEIYRCYDSQHKQIIVQGLDGQEEYIWNPDLDSVESFERLLSSSESRGSQPATTRLPEPHLENTAVLTAAIWNQEKVSQDWSLTDYRVSERSEIQEQLWGEIVAYAHTKEREWQQWERDFLQQLANQVAIAIKQSQLYLRLQKANQELEYLATTDEITGLANRRQFEGALEREWQRLAREQKPLSLILCDLDSFKAYNDTYGHPAGDRCLRQVAEVIEQSIGRSADLVARYGGEEFGVILPNTESTGAFLVAQRIQHNLAALKLPHRSSSVSEYITLSLGVATIVPLLSQSPRTLVEAADQALYRAKDGGRNRIVRHRLSP